jgi:hypothetical protein
MVRFVIKATFQQPGDAAKAAAAAAAAAAKAPADAQSSN